MELRQLRYLIAVADEGSLALAAESLGITRPALSLSLAKLEKEFGVRLFHRGRHGASVTQEGAIVLMRARIACSELSLAALEVDGSQGRLNRNVHVGANPHFSEAAIPSAILALNEFKPHLSVTAVTGTTKELFSLVRLGKVDFAACAPTVPEMTEDSSLSHEVLYESQDVLCVRQGHPLAQLGRPPSKREMLQFPWAVSARCDVSRQKILRLLADTNSSRLPTIVRSDATPIIRELVLRGDYIGMTAPGLAPIGAPGEITKIDADDFVVQRCVSITRRAGSPLSADARDFAELVRQRLRQIGSSQAEVVLRARSEMLREWIRGSANRAYAVG